MRRIIAGSLTGFIIAIISNGLGHTGFHPLRWVLFGLSIILVQVIIKE